MNRDKATMLVLPYPVLLTVAVATVAAHGAPAHTNVFGVSWLAVYLMTFGYSVAAAERRRAATTSTCQIGKYFLS